MGGRGRGQREKPRNKVNKLFSFLQDPAQSCILSRKASVPPAVGQALGVTHSCSKWNKEPPPAAGLPTDTPRIQPPRGTDVQGAPAQSAPARPLPAPDHLRTCHQPSLTCPPSLSGASPGHPQDRRLNEPSGQGGPSPHPDKTAPGQQPLKGSVALLRPGPDPSAAGEAAPRSCPGHHPPLQQVLQPPGKSSPVL